MKNRLEKLLKLLYSISAWDQQIVIVGIRGIAVEVFILSNPS
jgi:hypothetical protein